MNGRKQHRCGTIDEAVAGDDVLREFVVSSVLNDELHLVVRRDQVEVVPVILRRLAAPRALHIDDPDHGWRHVLDTEMAAGLDHHRLARREQPLHQRIDVALQQRFTAGHLDKLAGIAIDLCDDIVDRHLSPFRKRVRGVTPGAAQVTRGQANEHARPAGMRRFSLNGMKDFVDRQHVIPIVPEERSTRPQVEYGAWRVRFSTGTRPEPRAATPEVFWSSATSTSTSTTSTGNRRHARFSKSMSMPSGFSTS